MDRYSHSNREDEARALSALPDLSPTFAGRNGSDNGTKSSASGSPELDGPEDSEGDPGRRNGRFRGEAKTAVKHGENRKNQVAPVGIEPTRPVTGRGF